MHIGSPHVLFLHGLHVTSFFQQDMHDVLWTDSSIPYSRYPIVSLFDMAITL
jgi:hypothetical protein